MLSQCVLYCIALFQLQNSVIFIIPPLLKAIFLTFPNTFGNFLFEIRISLPPFFLWRQTITCMLLRVFGIKHSTMHLLEVHFVSKTPFPVNKNANNNNDKKPHKQIHTFFIVTKTYFSSLFYSIVKNNH